MGVGVVLVLILRARDEVLVLDEIAARRPCEVWGRKAVYIWVVDYLPAGQRGVGVRMVLRPVARCAFAVDVDIWRHRRHEGLYPRHNFVPGALAYVLQVVQLRNAGDELPVVVEHHAAGLLCLVSLGQDGPKEAGARPPQPVVVQSQADAARLRKVRNTARVNL